MDYFILITRITGFCLLCFSWSMLKRLIFSNNLFVIPTFRFGTNLIYLPHNLNISFLLLLIYAILSILLIAGKRSKIIIAGLLIILGYFYCLDLYIANGTFVTFLLAYLISILLYKEQSFSSLIIIKFTVISCYLYSVIQKIVQSDFISGNTVQYLITSHYSLRPIFTSLFNQINTIPYFAIIISYFTIIIEIFIPFGLCFQQTRKTAIISGLIFHGIIAILFYYPIYIFSIIITTGYLAFLIKPNHKIPIIDQIKNHKLRFSFSLITILYLIIMPLRIYFFTKTPCQYLSFMDRSPWSLAMYLFLENKNHITAICTKNDSSKYEIPTPSTLGNSNNELLAYADYIQNKQKDLKSVKLNCQIEVNGKPFIEKEIIENTNGSKSIIYKPYP